jgi:hypothetical protein
MASEDLVMVIDKPHFTVKLHRSLLEVDLKEGVKKKLEDFVEANPTLRGSLGFLFQSVIPLDVALKDIESVELDEKGQVKIIIPNRKDIAIPLEPDESKKLIDKLNELISIEKQREMERMLASARAASRRASEIDEEKARAISESRHERWKGGGPV